MSTLLRVGQPIAAPPPVGGQPVEPRPGDPRWVRPAFVGLLVGTALLFLVGLSASGYANQFYAAAAEAGSKNWEAFFYGSLDAGNSITVDKPPGSLWIMALSVRLFGLSSWSILVPQALEGVAAVAVLYAAVRRRFSAGAGLLAGAVLALTPVAVLMFRFDNPDALLVLVMTIAAYTTLRAVESGRTRWLVATGALLGFGFLTKQLQVLLVLPAFAAAFAVAAPTSLWRRVRSLFWGGVAVVVAAGWWIAIVELTPAADRPYIGGSTDNSILELTFGYNGFGRLTGNETGSTANQWGATGLTRLFNDDFGGQISWLLPAALVLTVAGLVMAGRRRRTDTARAAYLVWGGWLVVTALTFSLASGIIHPYYTVALAPAIAALIGIGATQLWHQRNSMAARLTMAGTTALTSVWAFVLLDRTPTWYPALRWSIVVAGALATVGLVIASRLPRRVAAAVVVLALASGLAGPAAYALDTAASAHTGSIPSAGPTVAGGGFGGGGRGAFGGAGRGGFAGTTGTTRPTGNMPGGAVTGGMSRTAGAGRAGGAGGLLDGATVSTALEAALESNASSYTWVAATIGSQNAASYELATGASVIAIGGFNGTDPAPTLAQFEAWVHTGKIHYFVPGGTGTTGSAAKAITAWVQAHYASTTIGGTTVYDLTTS
jgi:4-amino-4-deoxy-L-arabinose transferase-like glycosyltransferase